MAEASSPETLHRGLKALSLLRVHVGDIFKHLISPPQQNAYLSEAEQAKVKANYSAELSDIMGSLSSRFRELETILTLLSSTPLTTHVSLGNAAHLCHDINYDKTSIYPDMTIAYRWLDNMQEYSLLACQSLQSNFTKRNSMAKNRLAMRTRNHNNHNVLPATMDYFVATLQRSVTHDGTLAIELARPFGAFTVLRLTLDRTLRAVLVLRGFIIEWVLVKGFEESFEETVNLNGLAATAQRSAEQHQQQQKQRHLGHPPHQQQPPPPVQESSSSHGGKPDIWGSSRYQVFRRITEHANSATLHFYAPFQMENAIKAYISWFKNYSNLFSAKCRKCDNRLLNNMPPTWRDFRYNHPYHFECRP